MKKQFTTTNLVAKGNEVRTNDDDDRLIGFALIKNSSNPTIQSIIESNANAKLFAQANKMLDLLLKVEMSLDDNAGVMPSQSEITDVINAVVLEDFE